MRQALANSIVSINEASPERYVAAGIQNSARRAFQSTCSKLEWAPTRIQQSGSMVIARFKSHNRVRELLSELGLKPSTMNAETCVSHAFEVASGKREPMARHDPTEPFVVPEPEPSVTKRDTREGGSSYLLDDVEPSDRSAEDKLEGTAEEKTLSNEERRQDALIARIEMRVAGTMRTISRKIMPTPD